MLGTVAIRRLLMAIAIVCYVFAIFPYTYVSTLFFGFDCAAAFLFLYLAKFPELKEGSAAEPTRGGTGGIPMVDMVLYVLAVGLAFFLWPENFGLPGDALPFIICVIIATATLTVGSILPILPYDAYATWRPLFTMSDEGQWLLTDRLFGYGSCPLAICYVACLSSGLDFWLLTAIYLLCWAGIPLLLSYIAYRREGSA